ncbi:MAG TPA: SpoIID/LytB domain-containing protein, partial [Myxococcales bacterium]|nr:SpoIID/LytB domain-containing protein [Myxococcales bacterium]
MRRLATALLLLSLAARAEEIRIEVARGKATARLAAPGGRVEQNGRPLALPAHTHELLAHAGQLRVDGQAIEGNAPVVFEPGPTPLRVDGRTLSGRIEAWSDARGLVLVNALDLEEYVAAVVASEVPSDWPRAALEAQAVAARTFAVAQKIAQGPAARAHLGSSVLDQVYAGSAHPASTALRAARATAGEVLTFGSAPIAAYFSASCGGRSETAEDAFNVPAGSTPYLVS